ncbi:MAG: HAD-IA family hydrolase [Myxococcota bacterium]
MTAPQRWATAPIQGLLLDAVGTLVALREPPAQVYARIAVRHGIALHAADLEAELARALASVAPPRLEGVPPEGIPALEREAWRERVRRTLGSDPAGGPCFEELFEHYGRADAWRVLPGARAALELARERGVRRAVVSNMDARLAAVLRELGLARLLDAIVLPSNSGGAAKPAARIFHIALERIGVAPDRALYIGDRERGCIEGARAVGLRVLRYDPAGQGPPGERLGGWVELGRYLSNP